jgi:hypothetical protein
VGSKPLIFISHITDEGELARQFKQVIEDSFLDMVEIFVSSDTGSIEYGSKWLDRITTALRQCEAMLVFCSPVSITRPWINFEAGAGWTRDISVVPLCHSGLRPVELPLPLNLLQGMEAHDPVKLQGMFELIATKVHCKPPKVDVITLGNNVAVFEKTYSIEVKAKPSLNIISRQWPELFAAMGKSKTVFTTSAEEWKVTMIRSALEELKRQKLIDYSYNFHSLVIGGDESGQYGELNMLISDDLYSILQRDNVSA